MSMLQLLQANALVGRKARPRGRALPYLLSLPALLVCVAIIVPFVAAAVYSLQRYRLNLPYLRGFIGVQNYVDFLTDPAFWNTLRISLVYTALTVVIELLLGLGIALLLRRPTRFHNAVSIVLLLPLMTAPAIAASSTHGSLRSPLGTSALSARITVEPGTTEPITGTASSKAARKSVR